MPKKAKGGGGARRKVRQAAEVRQRELLFAEPGQSYGVVTSINGSRRFGLIDTEGATRLGSLRGALRRRDRVGMNDLVLFSERTFETDRSKVDVLYVYSADEARRLAGYEEIPVALQARARPTGSDDEEEDVVFDDDVPLTADDIDRL